MIRIIAVVSTVIIFLILSIPLVLVELLIGLFNRRLRDRSCLIIVQGVFRFILFISGCKITVLGRENVPDGCAKLFVTNHRSYFDILINYIQFKEPTGFVSKDSLMYAPMLNVWMKLLYCLFLNRTDIRKGLHTIKQGAELLKKGISVCICPEGTTRGTTEGSLLPFKEGSLSMAKKAACPVVPVALSNTYAIWNKQFPRIRPAQVILEYGKPFYIKDLTGDDKKFAAAYAQRQIQEMLDKNTLPS